jgi:cation diffusion facilitator family transporter
MASGSHKAVYAALFGNGLITIIKFIVSFLTMSSAMMAEAFHSMADMGNQLLLLLGIKRSRKKPDRHHPFGYGKEQYFWSFVVANMLFLMGAVVSVYQGINRIVHPHTIDKTFLIYLILTLSFIIESVTFAVAVKTFLSGKKDKSIWKALKESKDSNLLVVLVEDSAALTGLAIALIGVLMADLTGIALFDAIASIVIGVLLAAVAFFLANEMRKLLVGEGASESDIMLIRELVNQFDEVERLGEVLTMHFGPESILLAINIEFQDGISSSELEIVIDRIEQKVKENVPEVSSIFIEADKVVKETE